MVRYNLTKASARQTIDQSKTNHCTVTEHVQCKPVLSDKIQSDATYIIDLRDIIYRQCTADAQNLGAQSRYQS